MHPHVAASTPQHEFFLLAQILVFRQKLETASTVHLLVSLLVTARAKLEVLRP